MATSAWITHVKKYAKDNKIEYGEALKKAASTYKGASSNDTKKVKKSKRKSIKKRKSMKKR
jgi:hypothetical protein